MVLNDEFEPLFVAVAVDEYCVVSHGVSATAGFINPVKIKDCTCGRGTIVAVLFILDRVGVAIATLDLENAMFCFGTPFAIGMIFQMILTKNHKDQQWFVVRTFYLVYFYKSINRKRKKIVNYVILTENIFFPRV